MKIQQAKVRTSQLYFNGSEAEAQNEVVVKCFLPPREVMNHFGLRKMEVPTKAGAVIEDYGVCKMRVAAELHVLEFVTTMPRLRKTIKILRAYIENVKSVEKRNDTHKLFKIDMYGSRELMRKIKMEKIAFASDCVRNRDGWYL